MNKNKSNIFHMRFKGKYPLNSIRKVNIRFRLVSSFTILCVVPLIFISFLAYDKSSSAIEDKINVYSTQIINQVSNNLTIQNTSITGALREIITNPNVVPIVTDYDNYNDIKKQESRKLINGLFTSKFQIEDSITSFVFMKKITSDTTFSLDAFLQQDSSPLDQIIHYSLDTKTSHPNTNYILTSFPYIISNAANALPDQCIYVGSVFNDLMNADNTSILGVLIKESDYSKLYSSIDLGDDTHLFIVDTTGNVISSRNPEKLTVGQAYPDPTLIEKITQGIKDNKSNFTYDISNKKHVITYSSINGSDWFMVLTVPYTYVTSDSTALGVNIGAIALLIAVLALVIAFIITRSITTPLNKLGLVLDESSKGNLCIHADESGHDELTKLSARFNLMIKSINRFVKDVTLSSVHVLEDAESVSKLSANLLQASGEISATVQQVAHGASDQAENSAECVTQMNTLSLSVNLVNDNMNSITEDVNNTSKLSAEVREIMDLLNKKTILSKSVSTKVFHDINNLNNEMKKIQDIVTVIMEITEQTNLLSFNATIEAARAGEAGRGFAVVANEIKKLSDQSKQASNTIHTILSSIQAINDETISATSNADTIFKEQMDSVRWANDKINYILGFMDQITNKIFTMKTSVNDIFLIKQKTADSVVSISAVSEQNAAIVQEVAASTDEQTESSKQLMLLASDLNDMTESLTKALSNFIV